MSTRAPQDTPPSQSPRRLGACTRQSPLHERRFVDQDANTTVDLESSAPMQLELAGPRAQIFHDPQRSCAGIVTCGGLCPGINDVIKALVRTLVLDYKVPKVLGFRYGYKGVAHPDRFAPVQLTPQRVQSIHEEGGTILGSSRGPQDEAMMVDKLAGLGVNLMFCIGGDGTLRGAHALDQASRAKKHLRSVIGVPKTIDNDLSFVGRSFGFETAVYRTTDIIRTAYWEAKGAHRGIGLVKLMGRDSGFIAAYASLATPVVDICLIPEQPFKLEGPTGLLAAIDRRFAQDPWAVIVVAEGSGQDLFSGHLGQDASGNRSKHDIGVHLKERITAHFTAKGEPVKVRYIDPSYLIRGIPAHGTDAIYCAQLAEHAVHAAMAGRTDMVVGKLGHRFTHTPLSLATKRRQSVEPQSDLWQAVLGATRQQSYFAARS